MQNHIHSKETCKLNQKYSFRLPDYTSSWQVQFQFEARSSVASDLSFMIFIQCKKTNGVKELLIITLYGPGCIRVGSTNPMRTRSGLTVFWCIRNGGYGVHLVPQALSRLFKQTTQKTWMLKSKVVYASTKPEVGFSVQVSA